MTGIESERRMTGKTIEANQIENQTRSTSAPATPPMASLSMGSSTKLDQEPNPFEQSFSGAAVTDDGSQDLKKDADINNNNNNNGNNNSGRLTLPPVASITSPSPIPVIGGGVLPKEVANQFTWDTLRTGPLSPSMLQGPANPEKYYQQQQQQQQQQQKLKDQSANNMSYSRASFSSMRDQYDPNMGHIKSEPDTITNFAQRKRSASQDDDSNSMESEPKRKNARRKSTNNDEDEDEDGSSGNSKKKSRGGAAAAAAANSAKNTDDDEKRKNFLERNRIAALKCRQRKKQWLNNLQAKVEFLTSDNERLQLQSESLKEEIVNLKTLLLAHKECPVAQANGFQASAIQKSLSSMIPQQMMRPTTGMPNLISQPYGLPPTQGATSGAGVQQGVAPNNTSRPPPPNALSQQPSLPPNPATSASAAASLPQFQRANMVGMPVQQVPPTNNQQGMVAGGSSSILRF